MLKEVFNMRLAAFAKADPKMQKEYFDILQYAKAIDKIGRKKAKNIREMEFGDVVNLRNYYLEGDFANCLKMVQMVFGFKNERKVLRVRIVQFFGGLNHIQEVLEDIMQKEKTRLHKDPKQDLLQAGIEKLDIFRELNILVNLAVQFSTTPQEVNKWQYQLVHAIMWRSKVMTDIDDDMELIQKANSKLKK